MREEGVGSVVCDEGCGVRVWAVGWGVEGSGMRGVGSVVLGDLGCGIWVVGLG